MSTLDELRLPLAVTTGALVGLGVTMLALRVDRWSGPAVSKRSRRSRATTRREGRQILIGVLVGVLVLALTRWIVLAVAVGVVVALWQRLFGGAKQEREAINRIEGLAGWIEALRDTIAGAVGLEQAIPATAVNASPAIRPSLNLMVDRLRVREPLPDALMKFTDDLDDASADLVVAALILNARLRGPGLRDVLTALAASARDDLDVRRRVESSRRSTRRSVQIVVGVIAVVAGGMAVFNRSYVAPYGTLVGQGVLAVVLGLFALAVWWMRRLAGTDEPERFLVEGRTRQVTATRAPASAGGRS